MNRTPGLFRVERDYKMVFETKKKKEFRDIKREYKVRSKRKELQSRGREKGDEVSI